MTPGERQTVRYYDDNARDWGAAHSIPGYWHAELARLASCLPPGADILEIGSGTGIAARYFLDQGFGYLGTDVSAGLLQYAVGQVPDAEFRQLSLYALDTGRQFGGWWATASLIHIPHARMQEALTGIAACLSPGAHGFAALRTARETRAVAEKGRDFFLWQRDDLEREMGCVFDITDAYSREGRAGEDTDSWQWGCFFLRVPERGAIP